MRIATAKESYQLDEALFDSAAQRTWAVLLGVALVLVAIGGYACGFVVAAVGGR